MKSTPRFLISSIGALIMSHSRRRHLCSFIWVGMSTSFVLIASIILSGCGTPTPTSQPNPTESTPTPSPSPSPSPTPPPGSIGNPPLSLPDMYFVIDESESMMAKDPAGEPCDLGLLRYDIPLFMARIQLLKLLNINQIR